MNLSKYNKAIIAGIALLLLFGVDLSDITGLLERALQIAIGIGGVLMVVRVPNRP